MMGIPFIHHGDGANRLEKTLMASCFLKKSGKMILKIPRFAIEKERQWQNEL
jgi:hypothetical protein